jgi:hypothetical protein
VSADGERSDRASLHLARRPNLSTTCRDRDTPEWFKAAKARSEARMGRDLTHEEFTRLLLEIYELHEDWGEEVDVE